MNTLKQELLKLILRNKEIKNQAAYKTEYEVNEKAIKIIIDMAGPVITEMWKKEFLNKTNQADDNSKTAEIS